VKKTKRIQPEPDFDFKQALAYLQRRYPRLKAWRFRHELSVDPDQFGAVRMNSSKTRGKGGKFGFYRRCLDLYCGYRPAKEFAK
jgi:hypothetical protein